VQIPAMQFNSPLILASFGSLDSRCPGQIGARLIDGNRCEFRAKFNLASILSRPLAPPSWRETGNREPWTSQRAPFEKSFLGFFRIATVKTSRV